MSGDLTHSCRRGKHHYRVKWSFYEVVHRRTEIWLKLVTPVIVGIKVPREKQELGVLIGKPYQNKTDVSTHYMNPFR